jgi:hypothetical protein|uniref:antitoxin n=1 Tax=Corynebacterium jeikeium TaxID=38289 RepID=UPI0014592912|nr:antitoxin [Corynebacterium jeikeium]
MSHTIDTLLQSAGVPRYDKNDSTLSGGEHALAAITAVLVEHWDHLDGAQQRALVDVLEDSTRASENATAHLRGLFNKRRNKGDRP